MWIDLPSQSAKSFPNNGRKPLPHVRRGKNNDVRKHLMPSLESVTLKAEMTRECWVRISKPGCDVEEILVQYLV